MHAVVNHLPFRPDADWGEIARRFSEFSSGVKAEYPKMSSAVLMKISDTEGIFVGIYDDAETMQHVSSNVAAPWFAEHIRPFLAGPTQRSAGEVVSGFAAGR
jgi:hypothetical protein